MSVKCVRHEFDSHSRRKRFAHSTIVSMAPLVTDACSLPPGTALPLLGPPLPEVREGEREREREAGGVMSVTTSKFTLNSE